MNDDEWGFPKTETLDDDDFFNVDKNTPDKSDQSWEWPQPEHKAASKPAQNAGDNVHPQQAAPFVGIRGERALSEDDFRAHVASLLELANVGILTGAGASFCAGGWLVSEIGEELNRRAAEDKDLEETLDAIDVEYKDIESLWSVLLMFKKLDELLVGVEPALSKESRENLFRVLYETLFKAVSLAEVDPSEDSQAGSNAGKSLDYHRQLLRKLVQTRQPGQPAPWLFTLNYDLSLEWAAEQEQISLINGFDGLHSRRFSPRIFDLGWYSTEARGEARFGTTYAYLAKLHGSLTWTTRSEEIHEVTWEVVKPKIKTFLDNPKNAELPPCTIIPPSAAKYLDTIGFIQGEMFRRLAEYIGQPHSVLLVSGYSFSDEHVNRLLLSGLLNPTFRLVVFDAFGTQGTGQDGKPIFEPCGESKVLAELAARRHPSITFVGGQHATLEGAVALLPDPALIDAEARKMRQMARSILQYAGQNPSSKSTTNSEAGD